MKPLRIPKKEAYAPPAWEDGDAFAIQAVAAGIANEHQQRRAFNWIIDAAAGTYDQSYRPDSPDQTAFAEGRRFVGLQIVKLLKINPSVLKENHRE